MDTAKKVLILYASAGHGHEKAAQAVLEAFAGSEKDWSARAVDTLSLGSSSFSCFYRNVYMFQIKYAPWLWGMFYYSFDVPFIYFFMKIVRRILNSWMARDLERLLLSENPEAVVSTHFTSTEVTSMLKKKKRIRCRLVTVVTDYMPHWVWTASEVDQYVVAVEETKQGLVRRGVDAQRIRIFGIPIGKKFLVSRSKSEQCRLLGIKEDVFTVLITSGGAGVGAIQKIAEGLAESKKPVQLLVVCGTNEAMRRALENQARQNSRLKVFGFVNNMDELMDASDLVVGKGGGLTVTESFCKGKPVILFQSVPGQEARNVDLVRKYHAGFATNLAQEVIAKVLELAESPQEIENLKKGLRYFAKPGAAQDIVSLVKNGF